MSCNKNNYIGMVFSMTNEINNCIVAFIRDNMGTLSCPKTFRTGGNGTGLQQVDPLGSQGSITLSSDDKFLFVVNAGSNNISSFRICQWGLSLIDIVPSGGIFPNSLAINNHNLYVTNAGNPPKSAANVTGFHIDSDGHLSIVSRPSNNKLVVSEAVTNNLSVYNVNCNGMLNGPTVTPSNGVGPFGSAYLNNNLLVVAEVGPNALSSYRVMNNGALDVISGSVLDNQTGTCWVCVDPNEHYSYTSNTGSGTITRYRIINGGTLTVVEKYTKYTYYNRRPN